MRTSSSWTSYFMWKCERHIPTSKLYPSIIAKCPTCGQLRPDEAYRPLLDPPPPQLEEDKPSVRLVPQIVTPLAPLTAGDPSPTVTWEDGPEPELDEEPGVEIPDKVLREGAETPVVTKRPTDVSVTEKSKAHLCPGPKCRKVPRGKSPYCSKVCSDRCSRLRKKALRAVLTDEEITNLNRIQTVLDAWNADKV